MSEITIPENLVYSRPESLTEVHNHYCPGCTHGIAHRLIAEVMDEMNIREKTIGVAPVGCSVFAYNYFNCDFVQAPHGRAPAMATGVKRVLPDRVVLSFGLIQSLAALVRAQVALGKTAAAQRSSEELLTLADTGQHGAFPLLAVAGAAMHRGQGATAEAMARSCWSVLRAQIKVRSILRRSMGNCFR